MPPEHPSGPAETSPPVGRRRFLGYVLAAPTLVVAAKLAVDELTAPEADASVPSPPEAAEVYDLNDALTDAARPTANMIKVQMNPDGTASFALHRTEVGQGITTAIAMLIAEELALPLDKVHMTLADARPELVFNQLTGGSDTLNALYTPVRVAAAIAKGALLDVAAAELGDAVSTLSAHGGFIISRTGAKLSYGKLATAAAAKQTRQVAVALKPESQFTLVGKPTNRIDAMDIVTGRKQFTLDMNVPNALPTMVARPPTIDGKPKSVTNLAAVRAMPGVTDVATISTGVAVRAKTFGQCIDAVRALHVNWSPGTVDRESDDTVLAKLKAAAPPMAPGAPLAKVIDTEYTFAFASNSPLETGSAIADVRATSAVIWSSLKIPIVAQQEIAQQLKLPQNAVKVHVTLGGGSFGRRLFHDPASEAAEISQKIRKPVKLMWHRTDDFRQGRVHPMSYSRIRMSYNGGNVLSYEQRHQSARTDFSHGLGEIITASAAHLPGGSIGLSQSIFNLTQFVPYDFGPTDQTLTEVDLGFNTTSMRNVYSPNVVAARELTIDKLAAKMGQDPYRFRRSFLKYDRQRAVLDKAAQLGQWGKAMPAGTAQAIAFHEEYKNTMAAVVEIDCTSATVNRKIRDGVGGPRVTKVTYVVSPGNVIVNPKGFEAMMMGGIMDGTALILTSSLHISNGLPLEGSWDNYFYSREWNTPFELNIVLLPHENAAVPGAGESGTALSAATVACAYARATKSDPTYFPINHNGALGFEPLPRVPSIPESPTDGLKYAY